MIPTKFKLAGRTWHVKRNVKRGMGGALGVTDGARCVIKLGIKNKSAEEELHTFYHELCHAMCFALGWSKLNDDEAKIDALGSMLMQAITTMEYAQCSLTND